jgi:hypothetical protein
MPTCTAFSRSSLSLAGRLAFVRRRAMMRAFSLAIAVLVGVNTPSFAAMFTCQFSGVNRKSCSVDSTKLGNSCQETYSPTLSATCDGGSLSPTESSLVCFFAAPTTSAPRFSDDSVQGLEAAIKGLSERPGFRTVAFEFLTISPTKLALGYQEQLGGPSYVIQCVPNP